MGSADGQLISSIDVIDWICSPKRVTRLLIQWFIAWPIINHCYFSGRRRGRRTADRKKTLLLDRPLCYFPQAHHYRHKNNNGYIKMGLNFKAGSVERSDSSSYRLKSMCLRQCVWMMDCGNHSPTFSTSRHFVGYLCNGLLYVSEQPDCWDVLLTAYCWRKDKQTLFFHSYWFIDTHAETLP